MVSSPYHGFHIIYCFLFILTFCLCTPLTTQATREFWPREWECDDTKGTYTSNSTFSSNLGIAFSNLMALSSSHIFSNVTVGSDDYKANKVYALYDCRNDIPLDKCHRCIKDAVNSTIDICYDQPKEAVIIYEECMLRYANRMIFSTMELTPNYTNCALVYFVNYGIKVEVQSILKSLIDKAITESSSSSYFAIKNGTVIADRDFYFLVQCTPDLSKVQCKKCLTDALNFTVESCASDNRLWGQINGPSCQMRYDVNPFFNVSSSLISPSHSPPLNDQNTEISGQPSLVSIPKLSYSLFIIFMSLLYVIQ